MQKINIGFCKKDNLKEVINFVKTLKTEDNVINLPASIKYWQWKYARGLKQKNPQWISLLRADQKIAGIAGYQPTQLCTPWGKIKAAWGMDLFIDPDFRKQSFLYAYQSRWATSTLKKRGVQFLLTFLRTKELVRAWQQSGFFISIYSFKLRIKKSQNYSLANNKMIQSIKFFDKTINTFFKRVQFQYDFILYRDQQYLNWRYFKHPSNKYKAFVLKNGKEISGYIVVRADKKNSQGYILDILVDIEGDKDVFILLFKALHYLQKQNIREVNCLLSNKIYMKIFKKMGFMPQKKEHCGFLIKSKQLEHVCSKKTNWHITMGDGDFQGGH